MLGPGHPDVDLPVKLGNHTIGLRKRVPRLDAGGQPVRSPLGAPLVDVVDVKVRWCNVYPTKRFAENDEPEDRSAPMTSGLTALVAPDTDLDAVDVVVWPITGETTVDDVLRLSGPVHQVIGEPGPWGGALEVQLRKST